VRRAGDRVLKIMAGFAALAASSAHATDDRQSEIIVTGERQKRSVLDTPSSVAVFTGDELQVLAGADRLDQLFGLTPNVQLGSGGEGPTIRGLDSTGVLRDLPAFLGGTRPRVTLQVDGRAISYNELAFGVSGLWDLARLEIFRSPQTTTQGRNSIAGAIFVETRDPTFDWQGRGRLMAGNYDTRQASGVISGPLVDGQVAVRIAGDLRRSRTASRISSAARGIDANEDNYDLLRIKLLATPAIVPGLRLLANYAMNRSHAPQVEGILSPFRARRDPAASYGIFSTRVDSFTLRADYPVSEKLTAAATVSLGEATARRFAPPGFGEAWNRGRDASGELIATWRPLTGLQLVSGINLTKNKLDQEIDLTSAMLGRASFNDRQRSLGLFGEFRWALTERWNLVIGGRYQEDTQQRIGVLAPRNSPVPIAFDRTFDAFLPKIVLSYAPDAATRIGVQVQKAYNPGGTTVNLSSFTADTFEAETLWAYEFFARTNLVDSALQLWANLFYYDMYEAQRSVTQALITPGGIVTFAEIGNAPRAWSRGAEVEARWRPSGRLSINLAAGFQQSRLTRALTGVDPLLNKEFQRAPRFTTALAAEWRPAGMLRVSGQLRHNSGYYSEDTNDPSRRVSAATTVDARIESSWRFLSVAAYARNLLNEFHLTYMFPTNTQRATAGEPRKIGVELIAEF
jgi:outer membrane receptor protein involved in Fe transport